MDKSLARLKENRQIKARAAGNMAQSIKGTVNKSNQLYSILRNTS